VIDSHGRHRSLSFRGKLTVTFVGLAAVAIAGVSVPLTVLNNRQAMQGLRDKATRYAELIAPQLAPVVAFDDRLTAGEIFRSFEVDPDISGLAVYRSQGELVLGNGDFPPRMAHGRPDTPVSAGHIVVLAPIVSAEGPRGQLYVSLATRAVEQHANRSVLTTLTIALMALVVTLSVAAMLSRTVARRIGIIATAASNVAEGDLEQPDVEPGPDDEIGRLAVAFNQMVANLRLQFFERVMRTATDTARLESIVSERTSQLQESREQYRLIAESTNVIPFTFDPAQSCFTYVGPQALRLLGFPLERWKETGFLDALVPAEQVESLRARFDSAAPERDFEVECSARDADARSLYLRWVVSCGESGGAPCLRGLILDITEQRRLEGELAQAQKLESVGRLAAGVAHEINTPIQFVSDSVEFLREATTDLIAVMEKLQAVRQAVLDGQPAAEAAAAAHEAEQLADLSYLFEHLPKAFERSLEGLGRVTTIVRSMKEFAHPDDRKMAGLDLNRAIESTLIIARSEYKYVAELDTDYGNIPMVLCYAGDVNQAILNLVSNAGHAIADVVGDGGTRGRIGVRTYLEGAYVVIALSDTGGGIPPEVAHRIFDPFFTTKDVGKGTGQGLAIARSVIVDKHHGQLTFDSTPGAGTTFFVRLPVEGPGTAHASSIPLPDGIRAGPAESVDAIHPAAISSVRQPPSESARF